MSTPQFYSVCGELSNDFIRVTFDTLQKFTYFNMLHRNNQLTTQLFVPIHHSILETLLNYAYLMNDTSSELLLNAKGFPIILFINAMNYLGFENDHKPKFDYSTFHTISFSKSHACVNMARYEFTFRNNINIELIICKLANIEYTGWGTFSINDNPISNVKEYLTNLISNKIKDKHNVHVKIRNCSGCYNLTISYYRCCCN